MDSLQHPLTECGELPTVWVWIRQRIATILRTDPRPISAECLLRPDLKLWPLKLRGIPPATSTKNNAKWLFRLFSRAKWKI